MRLKDVTIRNAKPRERPYKLYDGDGLLLLIHSNGGKYWQLKYSIHDKEKSLSLGVYPDVSLVEAREGRAEARKLLRKGVDPSAERKRAKLRARGEADNDFKTIALEWHGKRKPVWTGRYSERVLRRLERDIFPTLGNSPITQILAIDLLATLRKIEERGAVHSAHRIKQVVGQVFRYAVAAGKVERDITGDLRGALQSARKENFSHLSANELPDLFAKLNNYDGERQTKYALQLLLLTFVRTSEVRGAAWTEFDLEKAEWRIPAGRMKMRVEHIVPLSKQALEILKAQRLLTGGFEHVFPNRNRPQTFIGENTMLYAVYRIGYHNRTTVHGFRSTASTILHEQGFNTDVVERQLAHKDKNAVRASYNHAAHLPARREMMQWWADYLEKAGMRI